MTTDQAAAAFDLLKAAMHSSRFVQLTGMTLLSVDADCITVRLPFAPDLDRMQDSGQFHGGVVAALIDTAACFAVIAVAKVPAPTANFRTDFLRPAISEALIAKATVRRCGRALAVADVDVTNDRREIVAVGRGTFVTSTAS